MSVVETVAPVRDVGSQGVMSFLFVFDVGQTYLTPPMFSWDDVGIVKADKSPWKSGHGFPAAIRPPLRLPVSFQWNADDPRLKSVLDSIPWCIFLSAQFIFFLEGIAVLRFRARLNQPATTCKGLFDKWEDDARDGQEPIAYQLFPPIISAASEAFRGLAATAKLVPAFVERGNKYKIHWIYPLFFSDGPALYKGDELLHNAPVSFGDSTIWIAWRGAHISGPSTKDREAVEDSFLAAALAWQSLHTLDAFLSNFLQDLILQQERNEPIPPDRTRSIRSIQFFTSHLIDASRPLRWTVQGSTLSVLKALDKAWETTELRQSLGDQTGLAGLLTLHYEKVENKLVEEEKQQREEVKWFFQIIAFILTFVTLLNGTANVLNLFDPNKEWIKSNWVRGLTALGITTGISVIALMVWICFTRNKKAAQQEPVAMPDAPPAKTGS